jgi:membrane fusion protein (multidrug efflux system)
VAEFQGITRVRVVGGDGTVSQRTVKLGQRVEGRWIVTDGLAAGDRVVVEGPSVAAGVVVKTKPYTPPAPPPAQGR